MKIFAKGVEVDIHGGQWPMLAPTDQVAVDEMRKKIGKNVSITIKTARSPGQHRMFFAMINTAWENQQLEPPIGTPTRLRKAILIELGYCEPEYKLNGEIVNVAKSIAFENMPQDEFNEVVKRTIDIICTIICPGMDKEELLKECR